MAQIEGAKLAIHTGNVGGEIHVTFPGQEIFTDATYAVDQTAGRRGLAILLTGTDPYPAGTGTYGSGGIHSYPDGHGGYPVVHEG